MSYFEFVSPLTRFTLARAEVVNALFQQISDSFDSIPDEDLLKQGRAIYGTATGTNSYDVTLPHPPETMVEGMTFRFKVPNTNTGACTVDIGPGPVAMVRPNGQPLAANDLTAGQIVQATWNGTNVRVVGFVGSDLAAAAASAAAAQAAALATAPVIPYLDEIAAVEAEIASVVGVATNMADVQAIASFLAEIGIVANLETEIAALGPISADITTVASNIADVITAANTVTTAGLDADIATLAGLSAEIAALGPVAADIPTLAAIDTDIATVAANVTDVTNFSDVYLGPHATGPSTRTDSSPLVEGDMYFDTGVGAVRFWDGAEWVSASGAGLLQAANNLDDLADLPTAITNLGLNDVVREARTISAGTGLTGGGNLSANRTIALSAGSIASLALADSAVQPGRALTAGDGLTGGGNLSADRTLAVDSTVVRTTRAVNTGTGLTGGGNLSANRTLSLAAHSADLLTSGTVASARVSGSYTGITGTGALNAGSIASGFGNINIGSSGFTGGSVSVAPAGVETPVFAFTGAGEGSGLSMPIGGTSLRMVYNGATRFLVTATTAQVENGAVFTGSGSGLTNLNAANLTGTIASARISGSYTGITGTGALNAGSIASGFGNINIGSSTFTGGSITVAQGTANGLLLGGASERIDYDTSGSYLRVVSGNQVRAKISTNGSLLIGPSSYTGTDASEVGITLQGTGGSNPGGYSGTTSGFAAMFLNRRASNGNIIQFYRQDDFIAAISITTGAVSYNTTSDAKAKENARDFDSGAIIDAITMREFDFTAKYGGGTGVGPLVDAEEAAKFPVAFTYDAEHDLWLSDYSKFVPVLWHDARNTRCELRDLRTRVAALEAA